MRRSDALRMLAARLRGDDAAVDWDAIIPLAFDTLTTPALAARTLGRPGAPLPEDVESLLSDVLRRNRMRNARILAQLEEALTALNAAGVVPTLLKGAGMLAAAPATRDERILTDIDLYISEDEASPAYRPLRALGYLWENASVAGGAAVVATRETDVGALDIHRSLGGLARFAKGSSSPDCFARVRVGAGEARLPPPTLQILYLTLHDQFRDLDYFRGRIDLRHLLDIRTLAESPEGVDWDELLGALSTRLARHAFAAQMIAAHRLLGVSSPDRTRRSIFARLQNARRMLQLDVPQLAPALSVATVLSELPLPKEDLTAQPKVAASAHKRTRRRVQRLLQPPAPGKL